MRTARNVAIVMALALAVAFAPAGGNAVDVIFTVLAMGFLAGFAWLLYTLSRQHQLTLATLGDGRRAVFYSAFGLIALLIAGTDRLFASGEGTLLWIALLCASIAAIVRIWVEANTHSY